MSFGPNLYTTNTTYCVAVAAAAAAVFVQFFFYFRFICHAKIKRKKVRECECVCVCVKKCLTENNWRWDAGVFLLHLSSASISSFLQHEMMPCDSNRLEERECVSIFIDFACKLLEMLLLLTSLRINQSNRLPERDNEKSSITRVFHQHIGHSLRSPTKTVYHLTKTNR